MTEKRSAIWDYFVEIEDGRKAKCVECMLTLSRGGIGKNASNSGMINHLKKHSTLYVSYRTTETERKSAKSKQESSQPTLQASIFANQNWDEKSEKAKTITTAIAEMIALDLQPLSMVENEGFRRLMSKIQPKYKIPSRKHFTTTILPDLYKMCKKAIEDAIPHDSFLSFTTDIWSSPNNQAVISLTVHWFDERNGILENAILNTSAFPGSHTGERIGLKIHELLTNWKISLSEVHLILRDNAANMIKGLNDAELPNAGCFIHTLQLVVLDALDCQKVVKDVITKSRSIVTHFNHSPLASNKLTEIQIQYNLPQKKLLQDIRTRWNSTFYMLERLIEQRSAVTYYAGEVPTVKNLTEYEWQIAGRLLILLKPFEEITKIVSSEDSCISEVIPYIATLKLFLKTKDDNDKGVESTKETLLKSLNSRFRHIAEENIFTFSTFLDPRFKQNFIAEDYRQTLTNLIEAEISDSFEAVVVLHSAEPTVNTAVSSGFWKCFEEIGANQPQPTNPSMSIIKNETIQYLSEKIMDRKTNPYSWWTENKSRYPHIFKLARKYLSAPASTVISERLFSTEGLVYEQHRNRILPENGEMLTCLKRNHKYWNSD